MSIELEALLAEREHAIARLRQTFRFSEQEAIDFLDRFGGEAPAVSGIISSPASPPNDQVQP